MDLEDREAAINDRLLPRKRGVILLLAASYKYRPQATPLGC